MRVSKIYNSNQEFMKEFDLCTRSFYTIKDNSTINIDRIRKQSSKLKLEKYNGMLLI